MLNKIRLLLVLLVFGVGGYAGYNLLTNFKGSGSPLKVKINDKGVDVEIENFKLEHQILGRKDWELKADFAQINTAKKTTHLKNVEVVLNLEDDQTSTISADSGQMNNDSQDINLEGNVKFTATLRDFRNRFRSVTIDLPTK